MYAARDRFHSNLQPCRCCNKISVFFLPTAVILSASNQRHSCLLSARQRLKTSGCVHTAASCRQTTGPRLIPSPPADDSYLGRSGTLHGRRERRRSQREHRRSTPCCRVNPPVLRVRQVPAGWRWAATKVSLTFPPPRRLPILAARCKPVDIYPLI